MQVNTQFPLATLFFKHWMVDDTEGGIVTAKASFARVGGQWKANPVPELLYDDQYVGDPASTPLVREQDIAPGKIGTDLILHAIARSPGGRLLPEWPVSLTVPDRVHYGFQVSGPTRWTHSRLMGWKRTIPELVSEVPITYDLAYGGASSGPDGVTLTFENNPSGLGFATPERLAQHMEFAAPQVGLLAEFMSTDPLAEMGVHGFGPIAKSWLPRRSEAGTFDDQWKATRHPRMPLDYSLSFWNAATKALQFDIPLRGDETLHLEGIAHSGPVQLKLPGVACAMRFTPSDGEVRPMVLDTVFLDMRGDHPDAYSVDMTWRAIIQKPEAFDEVEIVGQRLEN